MVEHRCIIRKMNRREFCRRLTAGWAAAGLARGATPREGHAFRLRYIVASSLYGRMSLGDVLPQVRQAGAEHIDIWPEHHANHREQIEATGRERFAEMLREHQVQLGILTRYDLGPFGLENEMRLAKRLSGSMVITGSRGPGNLKGHALKNAVKAFIEKMKPYVAAAEQIDVTVGIENHANSLIASADAMRWFAEFIPSKYLGVALAPYHLPQDPVSIARLITDIDGHLVHFYAWQYGMGCHKKLPKQQELLQLPGRGEMSFVPILSDFADGRGSHNRDQPRPRLP
ncbi:MAG: sugar phosphate isomerase/epimerase family protein [Planctomycetota bacterium]